MRFLSAISLFSFLYAHTANCQITITQDMTPEQYVNDILLGEGVTASNIQFTGDYLQLGHITEGSEIPIENGLILSSALATNPMTCELDQADILMNAVDVEPDLLTVANSVPPLIGQSFSVSSVNDVCILEFDFEASGDSISFNYIFRSDEYLAWVNSSYNDIFAFFLSGPGITGPFASPAGFPDGAINIAQVPNSDPELPITISSVNNVTNPEYYIDNPNNEFICINGYTQIFTASSQVQCGETYHIKLAIADGSDDYLESFVILQEGSFESNNDIDLSADASIEGADVFLGDTTVVEGCNDALFTVIRPNDSELDTIFLSIDPSSTATIGDDFSADVEMVIMEPGQSIAEIPLGVESDDIIEGTEFVTLEYEYISGCGDTIIASATIVIVDPSPITLLTEPIGCIPEDNLITLSVEPITGYAPYTYEWSIDPTQTDNSFIYDTEGYSGSTTVDVVDVCNKDTSITITWQASEDLWDVIDTICVGETGSIPVNGFGASYDIIYDDNEEPIDTLNLFSEILVYNGLDENSDSTWINFIGVDSIINVIGFTDPETGLYFGNFTSGNSGDGTVELQLIDGCGNIANTEIVVEYCELEFFNVFTPDNIGPNNNFIIENLQPRMPAQFSVFDRWGELVFDDINFSGSWDGKSNFSKHVSEGSYYFVLRINYDYSEDPDLELLYDKDKYDKIGFLTTKLIEPNTVEFLGRLSILRDDASFDFLRKNYSD